MTIAGGDASKMVVFEQSGRETDLVGVSIQSFRSFAVLYTDPIDCNRSPQEYILLPVS
jgi:hypothetical protein